MESAGESYILDALLDINKTIADGLKGIEAAIEENTKAINNLNTHVIRAFLNK